MCSYLISLTIVSKNEDENEIVRQWGPAEKKPDFKHHYEVLEKLDAYDAERGEYPLHKSYFFNTKFN